MANKSTSILSLLAKELGYKDVKHLKDRLRHGDDFSTSVKSRLEEGQGFGESFREGFKDAKRGLSESLDPKKLRKKAYLSLYGGDNIFSSRMRGKYIKKQGLTREKDDTSPSKESGISGDSNPFISILLKNSLVLPGMARDMNILRQNMVALVKLERNIETEKDLSKEDEFFKSSDALEAQLEEQRKKTSPTATGKDVSTSPTNETSTSTTKKTIGAGGDQGGVLGGIIDFFKNGLLGALGVIFSPANILKSLGKIFVVAALVASLFEGVVAGWKKWQETGELSEAILTGLGAMLDFLTFGLFGEEQLRNLVKSIGDVIGPIIDDISDSLIKMKDWIANNIGIPEIGIPVPKILQKIGAPEKITIGPYYPFKDNPKSGQAQTSALKSKSPYDVKSSETPFAIPEPPKELKDAIKGTPLEQILQPTQVSGKAQDTMKQIIQPMRLPKDAMKNPSALMDTMVNMQQNQIDQVKKLNAQGDYSLGDAKQLEKGLAESKKQLAIGQSKLSGAGDVMSKSLNNATDTLTKKIQGGGATENSLDTGGASMLSPSTTSPSSPSIGSDLGKASSQVSEGQRMESSSDGGSFLNSPITNNSSGGTGMNIKPPPADTHNHELINLLMRT
jgi:hypothetical protein